MTRAKIYIQYSDGCFCQRREFIPLLRVPFEPRFEFAKHAKLLARDNGVTNVTMNKPSCGRSASGILPEACAHRPQQTVRIDWTLDYSA